MIQKIARYTVGSGQVDAAEAPYYELLGQGRIRNRGS